MERTGRLVSRFVRVRGREFHYRVSTGPRRSDAPSVVLVHGAASSRYFVPLAEFLAPHADVYAPDLPGFGQSFRPPQPLGIDAQAHALCDLMETLGLRRAHLVGQSFGTNISVEVGLLQPGTVASLVLQGLTFAPRLRSTLRLAPLWLLNAAREFPKGAAMREAQREADTRHVTALLRQVLAHPLEHRLAAVRQPVLIVRGTRDPLFPADYGRLAASSAPFGQLWDASGETHAMHVKAPQRLAWGILRFISATSSQPSDQGDHQ